MLGAVFFTSFPNQLEIVLASLLFGYLIGGLPFGYLIPRLKGVDIRRYGSGNPGFTNVLRNLGLLTALPVLVLDIAKGFLPTFFAQSLQLSPLFIGGGAILGHLFTPFLGFRGGKGTATTIGVILALTPKIFLISGSLWIITFLLFSYASLASLLFSLILILSSLIFLSDNSIRLFFCLIGGLVIVKHIPNIKRLLKGNEPKTRLIRGSGISSSNSRLLVSNYLFLGAGRWAQSLALALSRKISRTGPLPGRIILWEGKEKSGQRSKEIPESIPFPPEIEFTTSLPQEIASTSLLFFSLPCRALREVLEKIKGLRIPRNVILISTIKGIEKETLKLPSQIIREYLPKNPILVLAGPGMPSEIAEGKPASLVIASYDRRRGRMVRDLLASENLRLYFQRDILGVELGGALKNVMAIASGILDGKNWGMNAKAALLDRGLQEMVRLAEKMGANPKTIFGLSGVGDLILTSFSPLSRNYRLGKEIGQGKISLPIKNPEIFSAIEGVNTCEGAFLLGKRYKLELPIIEEVYKILYEDEDPENSLRRLMLRDLKDE